jgi:hypothetical protein
MSTPTETDLRVYTPETLAEVWPTHTPAAIRELCRLKRIPAKKLGKCWLIPAATLSAWMLAEDKASRPVPVEQPKPYRVVRRQA